MTKSEILQVEFSPFLVLIGWKSEYMGILHLSS